MSGKVLIPAFGGLCHNSEEVSSRKKAKVNRYLDLDDDNHTTVTTSSATTVRTSNRTKQSIPQFRNRIFTPEDKSDKMAQPYQRIEDLLIGLPQKTAEAFLSMNETTLPGTVRALVAAKNLPLGNQEIMEQYRKAFNNLYNNFPPPFQTIERFLSARSQEEAQALLDNQACLTQIVRTLVVAENPPLGDNEILVEYRRAMQRLHSNDPPIQHFPTIFDFVQGRTRENAQALLDDEAYLVSHIRRFVVTAPIGRDEILGEYRSVMEGDDEPLPIQPPVTSSSDEAVDGSVGGIAELAYLSTVETAPEPGRAADPVAAARRDIASQDTASASVGNLLLFVNRNDQPNNPDAAARANSYDSSDFTGSTSSAGFSIAWSSQDTSAFVGNMDNNPDGVATANSNDSSEATDCQPPAKQQKL